jgi:septum formation inhibitor-activating ATPase MinD
VNQYLVMGKADRGVGIGVEEISGVIKRPFDVVVPYDKEVIRSIQRGQPVMVTAPGSEVSRAMAAGMSSLLGTTAESSRRTSRRKR